MKKIVPSTRCAAVITLRRQSGSVSRESRSATRFGYIREGINLALAMYNNDVADPVTSIDVSIHIGEVA